MRLIPLFPNPNPTNQDLSSAEHAEQRAAKALSEALEKYLYFPCDEYEAELQKQIKEYRQRWMYRRVRAPIHASDEGGAILPIT